MWDTNFGGPEPIANAPAAERGKSPNVQPIQSPTTRGESQSTPLTGYGRGDNLWGVSPTAAQTQNFPTPGEHAANRKGASREEYGGVAANGRQRSNVGFAVQEHEGYNRPSPSDPVVGNSSMGGRQGSESLGMLRQQSSVGMQQFRTQSQILSDELYHQSQWFPPPPPPRVPKDSRRSRSELWYYYASKWDITHTQPPPPRCPLGLMEEEYSLGLAPLTKVPYRGEYWLDRCAYWFRHLQANFQPPDNHAPHFVEPTFVIERCVCDY